MCASQTVRGSPCRAPTLTEPDVDGRWRCWRHTQRGEVAKARDVLDQSNRQEGVDGKKREIEHRRREARARADGRGPKVQPRKGTRGPNPLASPVPPAGEEPLAPEQQAEADEASSEPTLSERLAGCDLATADGRERHRRMVIDALTKAEIENRTAEVLLKAAADAAKDKKPKRGERSLRVNFFSVRTPEEGEAFKEARAYLLESTQ